MNYKSARVYCSRLFILFLLTLLGVAVSNAENTPRYFDPELRVSAPPLSGLPRLRFLTSLDFPPFNFADANKRPTGMNVELARAICEVLNVEAKCEIQALPWSSIEAALIAKRGEAIIAGTAISDAKRDEFGLSYPYFRFPGRFLAMRGTALGAGDTLQKRLADKSIAVVEKSAHEAMLKSYFPTVKPIPLGDVQAVYNSLQKGEAEFAFVDGVSSSFWLSSPDAANCCSFVGGPYYSEKFLGLGMAVVTRSEDALLLQAINSALKSIEESGKYQEIFERYFPNSPHGEGF